MRPIDPPILWDLFLQCTTLSLLAIGGAIATAPGLHRTVVSERGWLSDAEFAGGLALAQAAPGPNLLFVAVVGFQVGGLPGALASMVGLLWPSTSLTLVVFRWGSARRDHRAVQAFVQGMMPVTLGLVASTSWLLARPMMERPVGALLVVASLLVAWRTRRSPLLTISVGAVAGALGWV